MKANIRPSLSARERRIVAEYTEQKIHRGICRAQWLMIVAANNVLGIGKARAERLLEEYSRLVEEYQSYQDDKVEDELLLTRIRQIGLDVSRLYPD